MQLADRSRPPDEVVELTFIFLCLKSAGEQQKHLQKVSNSKTTNGEPLSDVSLKMTDCETKQSDSSDTCYRFSRVSFMEPQNTPGVKI